MQQGTIATEMGDPTATPATPDVMAATKARLGATFDDTCRQHLHPAQAETTTLSNGLASVMPKPDQVLLRTRRTKAVADANR